MFPSSLPLSKLYSFTEVSPRTNKESPKVTKALIYESSKTNSFFISPLAGSN